MKKIIVLPLLPFYLSVTAQTGSITGITPATGDLVISEIMADPTPSRGLPEREYLEITNRSNEILSTRGILLIAGRDTAYLSDDNINPGERVILCSTGSRNDLLPYGRVMTVKSFPSINDAGEPMALRNPDGSLIHAVCYGPEFLGDGPRSGGGWSAELADLNNPFNEPLAWRPSEDPSGGTPGKSNSMEITVPDTRSPRVLAVWPASPDTVAVLFDETVMIRGSGPWLADGNQTLPTVSGDHTDRTVLVPLEAKIESPDIITLVIPSQLTDYAGNSSYTGELRTGMPTDPVPGEILFNELMPDPPEGVSEYLELYNNSERIFDLSRLYFAGRSSSQAISVTGIHRLLLPGSYVALLTGREELNEIYPCSDEGSLFRAERIPSMPDDEGSLKLYDRNLTVIDRVSYDEDMHTIFLSGTEGVALEKVSPSFASEVASNWHSATSACNWGTPGAPNSIMIEDNGKSEGISFSSSRISPDGDGFEDLLIIGVFPGGEENVISVTVFNERGYPVRRLADRVSAGPGSNFTWDGLSDSGTRLGAGLYLVIAESINTSGLSRRWKKVCALLYR
jgi:hypothetical protein